MHMDQAHFFVTRHRCARRLVNILPANGDGDCRQNCREVARSAQAASRCKLVASLTDARRVAYTRTVTADTVRARTGWLRCDKIVLVIVRDDAKKQAAEVEVGVEVRRGTHHVEDNRPEKTPRTTWDGRGRTAEEAERGGRGASGQADTVGPCRWRRNKAEVLSVRPLIQYRNETWVGGGE